ncbi:hypothetical protein K438DRAFT_1981510 [Mycena galopus ATCC 62051]|nr:hypothetical protein K438DRAFT_1981510 [Mycena galopus ATCC 62051]
MRAERFIALHSTLLRAPDASASTSVVADERKNSEEKGPMIFEYDWCRCECRPPPFPFLTLLRCRTVVVSIRPETSTADLGDFELCDMEFRSIDACGYCEYMVILCAREDVEDAAVLGSLISHLSHRTQLDILLRAYQDIRYDRTPETQLAAFAKPNIFHLEDGPAQQAWDDNMRHVMKTALAHEWEECVNDADGNANDAEAEAEKWWVEKGQVALSRGE